MDSVEEQIQAAATDNEGETGSVDRPAPKIKTLNAISVVAAAILVAAAIFTTLGLLAATSETESAHAEYDKCSAAATNLMIASDHLTSQARMYVVTGDRRYMDAYFEELLITKRRDKAVATLDSVEGDERATARLSEALDESNELTSLEFYAMRLTSDADGVSPVPQAVASVTVEPEDDALSPTDKIELAKSIMLGEEYRSMKTIISHDVDACASELVQILEKQTVSAERTTNILLFTLLGIIILLMALVAFNAIVNYLLVTRPMRHHAKDILANRPLEDLGCSEIRNVVDSYNQLHKEVEKRAKSLERKAEIDALTGVYNRAAYDRILDENSTGIALILVDVDHFKEFNDEFGHEMGDMVLKKVATTLTTRFRSTDFVCRVGGDEFAVIATKAGPESHDAIAAKLEAIAKDLASGDDGLPVMTLSIGVAFEDGRDVNLFHEADKALYESKHRGRNTYTFATQD